MSGANKTIEHDSLCILRLLARNHSGLCCNQIAQELSLSLTSTQHALDYLCSDRMLSASESAYGVKGKRFFYHPTVKGLRHLQAHASMLLSAQIDQETERRTENRIRPPRGKLTVHLENFLLGDRTPFKPF